jgi:hypothetical protein
MLKETMARWSVSAVLIAAFNQEQMEKLLYDTKVRMFILTRA